MTIEEAKEIASRCLVKPCDDKEMALKKLFNENERLQSLINDRLPNGGMVSHGAKHSMKPTLENDKV